MDAGEYRGFTVEMRQPGIALITFNRPERMNGMVHSMKRDLIELMMQAQMDEEVRVVLFTGSGRAFSAGDDISGKEPGFNDAEARLPDLPRGGRSPVRTYGALRTFSQSVNLAVRHLDKLSIAAINGFAIQTGLSLALACDFRIASTEARLGSATLRFAYLPDEGGHALLVQIIGVAKTMDFLMRSRIVSAEEALELGLVHEVVPHDELMERAMSLATELANGPQVAMRLMKRSIYNAAELTLAQAMDDIASKTAVSDFHPDAEAGRASFRERSKPEFNTEQL
ncbi:MAG: enoyl-CoA hydratase/isomerase family protein [Chloroflexi bacterium]|nr:enoyl-CoA hydratase/isomerase family protein [Chloroflexota bacterium]MCI0769638.1 enoyl-CoA hydratase/isomerase family protein [Chloroflexota bacterium]